VLVAPRPGVNRENLLKTLQSVCTDVYNLRDGGGAARNAYERLLAYVEWTSAAVRMLGNQVSDGDLDRLVLTERYQLLAGLAGTMTSTEQPVQRVVNGLVSLELDERVADFEAAIKALQSQIARWSVYGHYVVPDTSFYVHHKDKLEQVDFGPLIDVWQSEVTVLVPIVIVDELDRLKESKEKLVRWRAGYTLAVLGPLARGCCGPCTTTAWGRRARAGWSGAERGHD
jgi:hypothetical protein